MGEGVLSVCISGSFLIWEWECCAGLYHAGYFGRLSFPFPFFFRLSGVKGQVATFSPGYAEHVLDGYERTTSIVGFESGQSTNFKLHMKTL